LKEIVNVSRHELCCVKKYSDWMGNGRISLICILVENLYLSIFPETILFTKNTLQAFFAS
jgi:hypothetical protein